MAGKGTAAAKKANPGGNQQGYAVWSKKNVCPVLLLSIDGKPAVDLLSICTKFTYERMLGKATKMTFTFRNDARKLLDDQRLFPNSTWQIRFGYWDDLSPVIEGIIRLVDPDYALKRVVTVTLYDAILNASTKSSGKHWGKVTSTDIAKAIAKKYGWKFAGEDSKDKPNKSWIQPNDVSDLRMLRDMAAMIDFEVFTDGTPTTLYYRAKKYDAGPKGVITYYDDPTEHAYVKRFNPKVKSLGPPQAAVTSTNAEKAKGAGAQAAKPKVSLGLADNTGNFRSRNLVIIPADQQNIAKPAPSNSDNKKLAAAAKTQMLDKCNEAESEHPLTPALSAGSIFDWRGIEKQVNGKWYVFEEKHEITGKGASTHITWKRNATGQGDNKNNNVNNKNSAEKTNGNPTVQVVASTGATTIIPPGIATGKSSPTPKGAH